MGINFGKTAIIVTNAIAKDHICSFSTVYAKHKGIQF